MQESTDAPRNELDEALAGIWAGALGLERVGIQDDFFDLGGNSLIAIDMVAQIRELTSVDIEVSDVPRLRTVAAMTDAIAEALAARLGPDDLAEPPPAKTGA